MLLLSATLAALTAASIYPVDVVLTTPKLEMLSEGPMYSNADAPLGADTSQITVILDMIPVVPVRPGESSSCTLLATRLPPHARRCRCRLSLLVLLRAPLSSPLALRRAHTAQGQTHEIGVLFTTNIKYETALPADALACTATAASDYTIQTFVSPVEVCHDSARRAPTHTSAARPLATVQLTRSLLRSH